MSLVDARHFPLGAPPSGPAGLHRKPLPNPQVSVLAAADMHRANPQQQQQQHMQYLQQQQQQMQQQQMLQLQQQHPQQQPQHRHTRTASSALLPLSGDADAGMVPAPLQPAPSAYAPQTANIQSYQAHSSGRQGPPQWQHQQQPSQQLQQMQMQHQHQQQQARRTLSSATTLTTASSASVPARKNSGSSLARSTSSRSGSSPTSYVALMRKQKATVWSDRAQPEDPRLLAQQRAAKVRATAEVHGAALNARTSTSTAASSSLSGGVRSKILHHGAARARDYVQTGLPSSGVPVRLSQNEIDENDDEHQSLGGGGGNDAHPRSGSGRSSVNSGGGGSRSASMYGMSAYNNNGGGAKDRTPPSGLSGAGRGSPSDSRVSPRSKSDETPVPSDFRRADYFSPPAAATAHAPAPADADDAASPEEARFGDVGQLPVRLRKDAPPQQQQPEESKEKLSEAELRRRGSVDERTMTMSGYGRLFIANPDA